jgi:hypothetical protein
MGGNHLKENEDCLIFFLVGVLRQKYDEYANKGNIHHGKIEINI